MNELYQTISTLNREESRNLKIFLNRTNASGNRKDITLFDFAKKNYPKIDESKIFQQLYQDDDKNSFYRLKNRLLNDINKSLTLLHYNNNSYSTTINLVNLANLFQEKGNYTIAYNHLKKAEKIANEKEFFDILDQIYNGIIYLSQQSPGFNPIAYIEKRKNNKKNLHLFQEIDDILAVLVYQINSSQNFLKHDNQFTKELQRAINKYAKNEIVKKSPKLRFKIYLSVCGILLRKSDFKSLEKYLLETYYEFLKEGLFTQSNHETKLLTLTWLVNSLFKNNKVEKSLEKTEELHIAMQEYDNLLYDKYLFYYYNSLVINYQVTDKQKAIEVLSEAKTKKPITQLPMSVIFINLNLALFYFDLRNFKLARKNIALLKREANFKTFDNALKLKINITELQIIYEIEDIDFFYYQLKIILKDFKALLTKEEYQRERLFLQILSKIDNKKIAKETTEFFTLYPEGKEENDLISYNKWLRDKLK